VSGEEELVDRTWRRIWWQTSAVLALTILAVAGTAAGVVLKTQHDAGRRTLQRALSDALASTGATPPAPAGVFVFRLRDGVLTHSSGAPDRAVDEASLNAAADAPSDTPGGHPYESGQEGHEYLVDNARAGATTAQAALNLTLQEEERHRLYLALAISCGLGVALAAAAGALIARRSIHPLGVAIARQRRFVADASHELRTPITQLHTRAQLLARSLAGGDDQAAEDARQLARGSRVMADIVEEMLLSAQLRSEPAQFGPVDLTALAADVVDAYRIQATQAGISLRLETAAEPSAATVRGIPGALRRAVAALVDNALGHVPEGGSVVIALRRDPAGVVCSVRDDGVGLDPADSDRIFERFARGSLGKGRRFGLGLALVRETVEAHGGTVTAASEPGRGATFTMRFPAWDT
jgi:signal transduction histidine kinase